MAKFRFEVEEREIYRFNIEAKDRDQAERFFNEHAQLYMIDENLDDVNLHYDITE